MAKKAKRPESCLKSHKFKEVSSHSDLKFGYCVRCNTKMWATKKISTKSGEMAWFYKTGFPFQLK